MIDDNHQDPDPEWLRNLPVTSEEIGFAADELVNCSNCQRANAPGRPSCIYCGAEFEQTRSDRFEVRQPEAWQNGFNVVVLDTANADLEKAASELAVACSSEKAIFDSILDIRKPVPIVRAETTEQAERLIAELAKIGVEGVVVPDEALGLAAPPVRLRSIEISEDGFNFVLFNVDERHRVRPSEIELIVRGVIVEGKTTAIERRKRRGSKTLSESSISSDGGVVDIYSKNVMSGWRIPSSGFDFSFLGGEKSLIAAKNMSMLIEKLTASSPEAKFVDDYASVRALLEYAWPSDAKRERSLLAVGRKDFANVFTTNNSEQFTKYSRLQRYLYEKEA